MANAILHSLRGGGGIVYDVVESSVAHTHHETRSLLSTSYVNQIEGVRQWQYRAAVSQLAGTCETSQYGLPQHLMVPL